MSKNSKIKKSNYIDLKNDEYELETNENRDVSSIYLEKNFNRKDIYFFALIIIGIAIVFSGFVILYQQASNEGVKVITAYGDIGYTDKESEEFKFYANIVAKSLRGGMWELQINGSILDNTVYESNFATGISIDKINKLLSIDLYDDSNQVNSRHIIHSIITRDGSNIREVKNDAYGISNSMILNNQYNILVLARYYTEDKIIDPWSANTVVYAIGNTIDATLYLKEK